MSLTAAVVLNVALDVLLLCLLAAVMVAAYRIAGRS